MFTERIFNNYYNIGGFNKPQVIGYMMKMIRTLKPVTEAEWKLWYLKNVHDEQYLQELALNMYSMMIKDNHNVSMNECLWYIYDVMFRRTFQGYNKEKLALNYLRKVVSPYVQESSAEWDTEYFIDFYIKTSNNKYIGIQLKPETFYTGNYQNVVNIQGKMNAFCKDYNAQAFILKYKRQSQDNEIEIVNSEVIDEIKKALVN